ncbi:MAG: diaminopimelate decarboxylase, partial [Coriobacteriia bacterium]|nr:diaminopimelate decarboxylase [Coriobacteriia bacterium]
MGRPSAPRPPAVPDQKTAADLMSVLPMTAEVKDGHLWIGGLDTVALAGEAGTAVYVMDEATIRHQLKEYVHWTTYHWPHVDVVYAGKAFMSVAMCKLVAEEGCCLDVSSGGELAFAKRAGFPMDRIYVHGNNKTPVELAECLEAGVGRIVVDSFEEMERLSAVAIERGLTQGILLRVTPGVEADTHDFIMTGAEDSKFGFGRNQGLAMQAVKRAIELPGIEFQGLHMHIGSQIFALHSFAKA